MVSLSNSASDVQLLEQLLLLPQRQHLASKLGMLLSVNKSSQVLSCTCPV